MSLQGMLQPSSSPPAYNNRPTSPSRRHLPPPWNHVCTQKPPTASPPPEDNDQRFLPPSDPLYEDYRRSPFYRDHFFSPPRQQTPPGRQVLTSFFDTHASEEEEEPEHFFSDFSLDDHSSQTSNSNDSNHWDDVDAIFDTSNPTNMGASFSQTTNSTTIDLTQEPESPTMPSQPPRKRRASQDRSSPNGRAPKRQRSFGPSTSGSQEYVNSRSKLPSKIEEIDLADDDDAVAQVLQKQREDQVMAQYSRPGRKKSKLCDLSCAVCMETPTELTATSCGHYFCRDCLLRWLSASEKEGPRKANCPSCRKTISRKKTTDIIPLEIMTNKAKPRR